ncbi:outer membrane protein [Aquicella lusitana]|mgnify:CR=1 FL=1|uniref:Opacity protein-like surface antigen n=1 Tax=Aquicella lusitana TaxID=254246 RepID=A0A370GMN4_9COXI|nr:outer membrane beta-barrel protein [Aquicella lusitana]RDI44549.1 opacity protein-like surface antigen [Aquicella lusitana]VVC72509.1 hypothetical protein AQULUS_02210 [Aquicella lusitana]
MNLSSFKMKVLTASLILASSTGVAFAKGYKGEANYKGEAMAAPCPPPKMLKDGWYVGGQVGYDSYRVRQNINTPSTSDIIGNPVLNATGWVGGLFLGYGQYLTDLFYLGGEIFANVSDADENYSLTDTVGTYNSKFEVNSSYGLALLPGLRLNDTSLGYIRLGWNWANLKGKENITGGASSSKSHTSNGFNLGLGLETLVYENWSVRTEYSHTWYNSFNSGGTFGTKFNPSDNQFMLGVLYHFA